MKEIQREIVKLEKSDLDEDGVDEGGDLSLRETLVELSKLSDKELRDRQDTAIAEAKSAHTDALLRGDTDLATPAPKNLAAAPAALPETKFVLNMTGFSKNKLKQEKSYWCGPASMAAIARGDVGSWKTQTYWAGQLGTTTSGTGIVEIVARVNSATAWDTKAGTYTVWNVDGKTTAQFRNKIKNKIVAGGPAVLPPTLLKKHFTYLNANHGGHFQVGTGYTGTLVQFIEPYNEADFSSAGAQSAGYQAIQFGPMRKATVWTSTLALRNIGA